MGWNHHGCQLSKSSESFVLNQNQMSTIFCWSPRIPVNEFFVGDDDEKESNMQGSLWLKAYWGLLRREWLTAQVFLLADSISLPPLFTQPTTASSALPAFRSGMRCDNTNSIGIFYQFIRPYFCHQAAYSWKVFYLKVRQQALVISKKVQMIFTSIPVSSSRSSIKC